MVKMETWQNPSASAVSVVKIDSRGQHRNEYVGPHQKLSISEEDRILNQELAATPAQDLFNGGLLIPVGETAKILNGNENEKDIALNPNMLSDTDLKELLTLQWRVFPKKLQEISSVVTLTRLADIAEESDATVKQMTVINERIAEVDPTAVRGENVILGRAKSADRIVPRGLDGDDEDYIDHGERN